MPEPNAVDAFKQIDSEMTLRLFLERYGFRLADSRSHPDQYVLGLFVGKLDGRPAKLTHRLSDQPLSQSGREQRNRIVLEIDGLEKAESGFEGYY